MRAIDSLARARLKLAPLPTRSLLPSQFTFYVAFPKSSIETRSLPTLARYFLAVLPSMSLFLKAPLRLALGGFAIYAMPRRRLGEEGSLASPRLHSHAGEEWMK
jgi:hypothetical protein